EDQGRTLAFDAIAEPGVGAVARCQGRAGQPAGRRTKAPPGRAGEEAINNAGHLGCTLGDDVRPPSGVVATQNMPLRLSKALVRTSGGIGAETRLPCDHEQSGLNALEWLRVESRWHAKHQSADALRV